MNPYRDSPLRSLPTGTMSLVRFASLTGVPLSRMVKHVVHGVDGERIEITKVICQCRLCRYVTPEQQKAAMAFWDRHGVSYRRLKEAAL